MCAGTVWKCVAPKKEKLFAWLLIKGRIKVVPTRNRFSPRFINKAKYHNRVRTSHATNTNAPKPYRVRKLGQQHKKAHLKRTKGAPPERSSAARRRGEVTCSSQKSIKHAVQPLSVPLPTKRVPKL